jgi:hypothetical protein
METPDAIVRALSQRLAAPVRLAWTENRAVYLSLRAAGGAWTLRLHECFRGAPGPVWEAVERYLRTGQRRWLGPATGYFAECKRAGPVVRRPQRVCPEGRVHHLGEILAEVQEQTLFQGLPPVAITWGRRIRPGRRHVRLGSYRAGAPPLIRVHPVLDDRRVPCFVVAQVVHHELVHHCLGYRCGVAEGRSHGRAFRELEAAYPQGLQALAWQERCLPKLCSAGRR